MRVGMGWIDGGRFTTTFKRFPVTALGCQDGASIIEDFDVKGINRGRTIVPRQGLVVAAKLFIDIAAIIEGFYKIRLNGKRAITTCQRLVDPFLGFQRGAAIIVHLGIA